MTRADRAEQNFTAGMNCSQAVLMAFSEDIRERSGLPVCAEETFPDALSLISRPFGGGMGRLRLTCGAVSGAVMALGLCFPGLDRGALYALVQEFVRRFREENGSCICGELLLGAGSAADTSPTPEARTAAYYKKRPCSALVRSAAEILCGLLG